MIATDEDALICDLAEVYGIFDYHSFPLNLIATLASGLRSDSRIRMKMNNEKVSTDQLLNMMLVDNVRLLVWLNSEDGLNGTNRPTSIVAEIYDVVSESDIEVFDSPEDYERRLREIEGR